MPVFLNIDLGELEEEPEELYALCSVANVACGGHAGDDQSMRRACAALARYGTRLAAHPSYPDRAGFGRRSLPLAAAALEATLREQLGRLALIGAGEGVRIASVKAHGALYHDAARDPSVARVLFRALESLSENETTAFVGPPEGALAALCREHGRPYFREGFADRLYLAHGALAPRETPGSSLSETSEVTAQGLALATSGAFETICLHGDHPNVLPNARALSTALRERGLLAEK